MPTESFTLSTDRRPVSGRQHGDPDGLPMLLLHGSLASSRWWLPLFDVLPDEFRAVAPDLRGSGDLYATGKLDAPADDDYAIETQAADILALVDKLGWTQFDLVAHSSGGAIGVEFALQHPERLSTLVLVSSVPVEGVFSPLETLSLLAEMRGDRALLRQALATLMPSFDLSASENETFFKQLVADAQAMPTSAFTGVAAALGRWNRFAEARAITLPTVLIWGDRDEIVSRDAAMRTLLAIPGAANLEVLYGCGHSLPVEAPLRLAERIVDFITSDLDEFAQIRQSVE